MEFSEGGDHVKGACDRSPSGTSSDDTQTQWKQYQRRLYHPDNLSRKPLRRICSLPRDMRVVEYDMLHEEWEDKNPNLEPHFINMSSCPPTQTASILRRKSRSSEDLKTRPERRRPSVHAVFRRVRYNQARHPSPSIPRPNMDFQAPKDGAKPGSQSPPICENCLRMDIEKLASPGGFVHSTLLEMKHSVRWCELCQVLKLDQDISHWTGDRYRITVSLNDSRDGLQNRWSTDDFSPQSRTKQPRVQCPSQYGHDQHLPFNHGSTFSSLLVEVVDQRPWEPIECLYFSLKMGIPKVLPFGSAPRMIASKTLLCLTQEHDPAQSFGVGYVRPIGINTSSQRSFEIAAGWLRNCLSADPPALSRETAKTNGVDYPTFWTDQHPGDLAMRPARHPDSLPGQHPGRLIKINLNSDQRSPNLQLIESNDSKYQYAALSYCWGKADPGDGRPWQTLKATVASHLVSIDRYGLPQALKDALSICEKLQIGYLWADSLCIIQDLDDDWQIEAAKMSGIYMGSVLTLSFSSAQSVEGSCFNKSSTTTLDFINSSPDHPDSMHPFDGSWVTLDATLTDGRTSRLHISSKSMFCSLVEVPTKMFRGEVLRGALAKRAWVLQEHVLPRRTLHITSKQLFWECEHCRLSEDNYPQHQQPFYSVCDYDFPLNAEAILYMWYDRIVTTYSERKLTKETDKLIAISALAQATYLNRRIDYVAGLWVDCILPGLRWRRVGPGNKSKTYVCPSWSWASQNSAVSYGLALRHSPILRDPNLFPIVQEVSWKPKSGNPFADVVFAFIDVETKVSLGTVLRRRWMNWQDCSDRTVDKDWKPLITTGSGGNADLTAEMDDDDAVGQKVTVAFMGCCFLVLEPAGLHCQTYRRVGIATLRGKGEMDDVCKMWLRRSVRLV